MPLRGVGILSSGHHYDLIASILIHVECRRKNSRIGGLNTGCCDNFRPEKAPFGLGCQPNA